MERFRKELIVNDEKRIFEFSKMRNMNGVKFFVTSFDSNQKPISFSLKESGERGGWKLAPGALRWLYAIETELSDAIIELDMSSPKASVKK